MRESKKLLSEAIDLAKRKLSLTGMTQYRVIYLKNGKEYKSGWFRSRDRAKQAYKIVEGKGYQAVIYRD